MEVVMRWALVSTVKSNEKSDLVPRLVASLCQRGARVAGLLHARGAREEDHAVLRIGSDERVALGRRGTTPKAPTEEVYCSFTFDRGAFERARAWLDADTPGADVLVIDEVGKLEAVGGGHGPALAAALASGKTVIVVARAHQLPFIVERFSLGEPIAALEEPYGPAAIDAFCAAVVAI